MSSGLHVVTFCHDIAKYPPLISLINYLDERKQSVLILGYCSSPKLKSKWHEKGISYKEVLGDVNAQAFSGKLIMYLRYKRMVRNVLCGRSKKDIDKLWVVGSSSIFLLNRILFGFKTIFYHMEMPRFSVPLRYKFLSPTINYIRLMQSAFCHVSCDYNRSSITKHFFGLDAPSYVVPNKTFEVNDVAFDLSKGPRNYEVLDRIEGKKVVLYQGIFNYPERRLDELCESVSYLPSDYVVLLMGGGYGFNRLKEKFESDRVLFQSYVPFPDHLEITRRCYIGFLSYFPSERDLNSVLNTLYCAPNKIYEYSALGLPFVSNDLPSLRIVENQHGCGVCVEEFCPENIAKAILLISESYDRYSERSRKFYLNQDNKSVLDKIVLG